MTRPVTATDRAREIALAAAQAAADKLATDVVLLDFSDVVVHVQHAEERSFYALERLWKDCPAIPFVDQSLPAQAGSE